MKTKIACTVSLCLIVLAACAASGQTVVPCGGAQRTLSINWYQGNFDPCLTGNNPYETILNSSTVPSLKQDWFALANYWFSTPVVVNGVVYTYNNGGNVEARSAVNGSLLWQYSVAPAGYDYLSSPAMANGILYVADGTGVLWALKATDGTFLWKYATNSQRTFAPTVSNGVVYAKESAGDSSYTYALDATTGSLLWKYLSGGPQDIQPAVDGKRVYAGGRYHLDALDPKTGAPIWTSSVVGIPGALAVSDGRVYVVDKLDTNIYALNAASGQKLWTYHIPTFNALSIALANGRLYAKVGLDAGFVALDAYTGNLLWQTPGSGTGEAYGMAVANGIIYTNIADVHNTRFTALDGNTGAALWSFQVVNMGFASGPIVVNGVLYAPQSALLRVFHLPKP